MKPLSKVLPIELFIVLFIKKTHREHSFQNHLGKHPCWLTSVVFKKYFIDNKFPLLLDPRKLKAKFCA